MSAFWSFLLKEICDPFASCSTLFLANSRSSLCPISFSDRKRKETGHKLNRNSIRDINMKLK